MSSVWILSWTMENILGGGGAKGLIPRPSSNPNGNTSNMTRLPFLQEELSLYLLLPRISLCLCAFFNDSASISPHLATRVSTSTSFHFCPIIYYYSSSNPNSTTIFSHLLLCWSFFFSSFSYLRPFFFSFEGRSFIIFIILVPSDFLSYYFYMCVYTTWGWSITLECTNLIPKQSGPMMVCLGHPDKLVVGGGAKILSSTMNFVTIDVHLPLVKIPHLDYILNIVKTYPPPPSKKRKRKKHSDLLLLKIMDLD